MFKKLLILTLSALLCCGAAIAADTTSMTDKVRQAETQSLPSTIKHLDLVLVLDKSAPCMAWKAILSAATTP